MQYTMTVYGLKTCGTTRKALAFLERHGVAHRLEDIRATPPPVAVLTAAVQRGVPLKKLFNTSGGSYREGGYKDRIPDMTAEEAIKALAGDPMLIKRPVLVTNDVVLVGFDEEAYRALLASAGAVEP